MMAALEVTAVVPAPPNPDEDAWLYGDTQPKPNGSTLDANATEFISQAQNGQNSEEDSDSDDDDVQITIEISQKQPLGLMASLTNLLRYQRYLLLKQSV